MTERDEGTKNLDKAPDGADLCDERRYETSACFRPRGHTGPHAFDTVERLNKPPKQPAAPRPFSESDCDCAPEGVGRQWECMFDFVPASRPCECVCHAIDPQWHPSRRERAAPAAPSALASEVASADLRRDVLWREREQELTGALRAAEEEMYYAAGKLESFHAGRLLELSAHIRALLASNASATKSPPSLPEIASELNQGKQK